MSELNPLNSIRLNLMKEISEKIGNRKIAGIRITDEYNLWFLINEGKVDSRFRAMVHSIYITIPIENRKVSARLVETIFNEVIKEALPDCWCEVEWAKYVTDFDKEMYCFTDNIKSHDNYEFEEDDYAEEYGEED